LAVFISLATVILFAGCSTTVTPRVVLSSEASWDGTNQNSGVIGFYGVCGVITPHARDRYNGLIDIYGKKFIPPIAFDYGISKHTNENYLITPQGIVAFAQMNRWRRSSLP
jgi:hypothetical protein